MLLMKAELKICGGKALQLPPCRCFDRFEISGPHLPERKFDIFK